MFTRIALFLATNLAVMLLLGIVLSVLQGVFGISLGDNGTLLVFAAVFDPLGPRGGHAPAPIHSAKLSPEIRS